jgi:drug/metabolite transporter (DMT)-like permease
MVLVGSSVAVSRTLVGGPLFAAQAVRYAAAIPLLLLLARRAGVPLLRPRGREWLWLAGLAATGLVLFNVAIVHGVAHAQPAAIAVAVSFAPVLLGVAGPLLRGQSPQRRVLLAAAVVTAGGVLVEGAGLANVASIGWAALALACEAAFTLLAVPVLPRHGAWGVSAHSVWLGAVMFAVLSLGTEGPAAVTRLTPADLAAVGYLAVVVTAAAFLLWYSAVAALGPDLAGLLAGIAPASAAVAGVLTGGRAPAPLVWLGILVIIAGLVTGLRSAAPPPPPPAPRPQPLPAPRRQPAPDQTRQPRPAPHQTAQPWLAAQEGEPPCSATTTPSPSGTRRSALA